MPAPRSEDPSSPSDALPASPEAAPRPPRLRADVRSTGGSSGGCIDEAWPDDGRPACRVIAASVSCSARKPVVTSTSCSSSASRGSGRTSSTDAFDGGRVEQAGLIRVEVDGPARLHGMRSPLFERGIVHERVRRCVQHFVGERGRLGRVARHELQLARMNGGQHLRQARRCPSPLRGSHAATG